MRTAIFLLFLCSYVGSVCAQTESNYELTVIFEPSFSNIGEFTIRRAEKGSTIQLKVWNKGKRSIDVSETVKLNESQVIAFQNLLRSYEFIIKTNQDTIGTERIFENGDSVTAYIITEHLDGVNVKGTYTTKSGSKHFAFWSPEKNSSNYRMLENILSLSKSFKRKRTCKYLKTLERHF